MCIYMSIYPHIDIYIDNIDMYTCMYMYKYM